MVMAVIKSNIHIKEVDGSDDNGGENNDNFSNSKENYDCRITYTNINHINLVITIRITTAASTITIIMVAVVKIVAIIH